ncbi:MAG TPA: AbrB/MazE/SpoVT family DNA-binding domain-containing protein [Candidatus Acidoferrum sp.]|nr:AbrB/MazE/SpoVT family DNA-binding domain-containing protein [Candidatus Acidoferrum sp.]
MKEQRTRVDGSGRVVILAPFRRALGVQAGDVVILRIENKELRITIMQRRLAKSQQLLRKHVAPIRSLVDELIGERRDAARRERD